MRSYHSRFRTPAALAIVFLAILLVCATASAGSGETVAGDPAPGNAPENSQAAEHAHTVMHFTKDQLDLMQVQVDAAPKYHAPKKDFCTRKCSFR